MADQPDDSQKTESATPHRLEEARKQGQVASSREVATFLSLAAAVLAWAAVAPAGSAGLALSLRPLLEQAGTLRLDPGEAGVVLLGALRLMALALAVPLALLAAAPVAAAALQNAVVWSGEGLTPKLDRLSPLAGFKRVYSAKALVEFAKSLVKLAVVLAALVVTLWPERERVVASLALPLPSLLDYLREAGTRLLATAAGAIGLIALLDHVHARFALLRQLRMSRQEVMDEMKQNDGDPIVRQRLKGLRMERARRRMMADVPRSTVVITNPTHFAVALRYVAGETAAPQVLAQGADAVALRIRGVAAEHRIPIVENPPLARALHAACDIGDVIPAAHYQAVAEIVGYVLRLNAGRPPAEGPATEART